MPTLPLSLWLLQLAADFTEVAVVWLVQSTVILLVGLAASRLLARRGPALQSALYRTTLVAVVCCPLSALSLSRWAAPQGFLPAIEVGVMRPDQPVGASQDNATSLSNVAGDDSTFTPRSAVGTSFDAPVGHDFGDAELGNAPFEGGSPNTDRAIEAPIHTAAPPSDPASVADVAPPGSDGRAGAAWQVRTGTALFAIAISLAWLLTSLVLLVRIVIGLRRMRQLCRSGTPVEPHEQRLCNEHAAAIGVDPPLVERTPFLDSPCLAGLLRPVILLPEEPLRVPLEAVLIHELAHLRRGDHFWNLAARLSLAVAFFQPLLWRLVRRLEIAAEEVCDDHVVHFGADRTRYADGLVALAEQSNFPLASIGVPLVTLRSLLAHRVRRILEDHGSRSLRIGQTAFCVLICAGVVTAVLGGFISSQSSAETVLVNISTSDQAENDDEPERPRQEPSDDRVPAPVDQPRIDNPAAKDDSLPAGAIARLGTTRFRPPDGGETVNFLPGNKTLALMTRDGVLEHWDAETGRFLRGVQVAPRWIPHAEPTPNGRFVAAYGRGMDDEQRRHVQWTALFDVVVGRELTRLELDKWYDGPLAIAANGSVFATAYKDVKIIDSNTGDVHDLQTEPVRAQSLALSPDGTLLAAGSSGLVRLWNWRARQEPRYFVIPGKDPRNKPGVTGLTFSPDASLLAASDREYGVSLIDLRSGEETHRLSMKGVESWQSKHPIFSPNGKLLAAPISKYDGGGVAVWEVASGKLTKRLEMPHEGVTHIAFSSDSRLLAGSNWWESLLCVWNVETGELLGRDLAGHRSPPNTVRFLPGDERLASAGDDGTVHLWNLKKSQPERVLKHERGASDQVRWIRAMDVSPDGRYVVSSSLDDTVRLWEIATGRELFRFPGAPSGGQRSVRFSPDSRRLASWGDDMRLAVYDVTTGKPVANHLLKPTGVKVDEGAADPFGGGRGDPFRGGGRLNLECGILSPDASRLAVALVARDALANEPRWTTHVFDVESGREVVHFERAARSRVSGMEISPDNQYVLLIGQQEGDEIILADGKTTRPAIHRAELRNLAEGKLVGALDRDDGGWARAAFSPDSRRLAIPIGRAEPRVVIVEVPRMTEIARIEEFRAPPRAFEFSHSAKLLAVSNGDTSVVVYDLDKLPGRDKP
ncbi:MAG: M56 family metallopeptidase [Pirellulales bacterium]